VPREVEHPAPRLLVELGVGADSVHERTEAAVGGEACHAQDDGARFRAAVESIERLELGEQAPQHQWINDGAA